MGRGFPAAFLLAGLLAGTVGCQRGAQSYLTKGNKLFAAGAYAEASINYRKSIQKDGRSAEAYYRLGLTERKRGNDKAAYRALMAARTLAPSRLDIPEALADFLLRQYLAGEDRPAIYNLLQKLSGELLAADRESYDGLRIQGVLNWSDGRLADASDSFRRANLRKPMQPELIVMWSQVLLQKGQSAEGEQLALALIEAHKDAAEIYDVLFRYYQSQQRAGDAAKIVRAKADNNPSHIDFALELAAYYDGAGMREELSATLRRLLENPQSFPDGHMKVGDFYAARGQWEEALEQYKEGARLHPEDRIQYLKQIVDVKLAQDKPVEAQAAVAAILKDNPKDGAAEAVNAALLLETGSRENVEAGLKQLRSLVNDEPANAVWRYLLGKALLASGDLIEAGAQFQGSLKRRPGFLPARLALAEVSQLKEDYRYTLESATEILSMHGNLPEARLLRAVGLRGTGRLQDARRELLALEKEFPRNTELQYQLAVLDMEEQRFPEAEARLGKLYNNGKGEPRALAGLVDVFRAGGRLDKALGLISDDLKRSPDSAWLQSLLADTYLRMGKYDLALAGYRKLLAKEPQSVEIEMRIGTASLLQGDISQAVVSFQKAHDLEPGNLAAMASLADALRLAGRKQEAIAAYRRLLTAQPDNAGAMNNLAYLLAEGDSSLDEAQKLAQKAVQREPREADFLDTLAVVYTRKHLGASAVAVLGGLVRDYPENPLFRQHYALALAENGRPH